MSLDMVAVVLVAAFLHASWNAIVKGGQNKLYEITLVTIGGGVLAGCTLPFLDLPARESWPLLALSSAIHFLYHLCIPAAYARMDLSYGYTLMRGTAPLFTTLVLLSMGTPLSTGGAVGIACLCGGVLALSWDSFRTGRANVQGTLIALGTACIIMGYTLSDGFGARASGNALSYTAWIFFLNTFPITSYVLWRYHRDFIPYARSRVGMCLLSGGCGVGSYGIALWAMTHAPIPLVAALRETSVVFGMLLGVVILKEPFTKARAFAVALMLCGTAAIRLS